MIGHARSAAQGKISSKRRIKYGEMDNQRDGNKEVTIIKSAVENTNEAFVTIDRNHKVLFFNRAAEKIFGYSREEVIGNDLDVIMAQTCSRNHREAVDRYIRTGIAKGIGHASELLATRKDGTTFPANISFSVSKVNGDLYFTGIVRDLTETKALQERILRSERLAALGQFVAEITHEIKNPLMMIGGFARQLIQKTKDDRTLTKLNIISEEVRRLEELLKELREYYVPRALNLEEMDVFGLLQEVYDLIKEESERKRIEADFKRPGKSLLIKGDKDKLKQVFLNLVKNAIDAMEKGGRLVVAQTLAGEQVEITITDNGCGIPEENREEIFSPFFTTKRHGTGLGLNISKSIIEDHEGGSLTLTSEVGKGTTFKVTLPLFGSRK
jgi:PAS domain S-box-containing protein